MSSFSRFQEINQKRGTANQETNASFILQGYPSISLTNNSGDKVDACVVNRQEKDMAYIYTNINTKLNIGSSWTAKGLNWLITEEIIIIKDVKWHKYIALLCNVELDGMWGFFIGPEKKHIDVTIREDAIMQSRQKPILILPDSALKIKDKIMIKDRAWVIQEKDNISTPGLAYYSLEATTMSKEIIKQHSDEEFYKEEVNIELPQVKETTNLSVLPNEVITLKTEDAYFKASNTNINIISLTEHEVKFSLPIGIKTVTITIKRDRRFIDYIYEGGLQ